MTVLLSAGPLAGVGEGVVEGVERTARRDRHLEAISDACVLDRDRHRVHVRVPEQEDADTVALAGGELAGGRRYGANGSSFARLHAADARKAAAQTPRRRA